MAAENCPRCRDLLDAHLRAHRRVIRLLEEGQAGPAFQHAAAHVECTWSAFTEHADSHCTDAPAAPERKWSRPALRVAAAAG